MSLGDRARFKPCSGNNRCDCLNHLPLFVLLIFGYLDISVDTAGTQSKSTLLIFNIFFSNFHFLLILFFF
jgi:hypothetical protein